MPVLTAGLAVWWAPLALLPIPLAGYAAATYVAAQPSASLAQALGYGVRRCAGLTLWTIVTQVFVGAIGLLAVGCAVGLFDAAYVAVPPIGLALAATALVGPAYLFEGGNPITRSLHLFLGDWLWTLRRLALIGLAVGLGAALMALLIVAGGVGLLAVVLQAPLSMILFAGILDSYLSRSGRAGVASRSTPAAR